MGETIMNQPPVAEAKCPSCGRFVGAYETCPYCQASLDYRISLKWVKRVSVWGSVIGLILIWFGVRYREVPVVQVGSIDLQYNMAVVRLEGNVVELKEDPAKDSFRITIDDGTGRASLGGYGKLAMFKNFLNDQFPQQGDRIAAIGNLSVSESWGVTMFLSSPRRLMLLSRAADLKLTFAGISPENMGQVATFTGAVADSKPFNTGLSVTLRDDTGEINLTVFESELGDLDPAFKDALSKKGAVIQFLGRVDSYRNHIQLRLVNPAETGHVNVLTGKGK